MEKDEPAGGLHGEDKRQGDLRDPHTRELPEGLRRDRKGPLNPSSGRHDPDPKA